MGHRKKREKKYWKKRKKGKKEKEEEKEKLQESLQIKEKNTSTSKIIFDVILFSPPSSYHFKNPFQNHWESFLNSFGPSFRGEEPHTKKSARVPKVEEP
jgi:hypothetical protein